jgi:hypothetical protein
LVAETDVYACRGRKMAKGARQFVEHAPMNPRPQDVGRRAVREQFNSEKFRMA